MQKSEQSARVMSSAEGVTSRDAARKMAVARKAPQRKKPAAARKKTQDVGSKLVRQWLVR